MQIELAFLRIVPTQYVEKMRVFTHTYLKSYFQQIHVFKTYPNSAASKTNACYQMHLSKKIQRYLVHKIVLYPEMFFKIDMSNQN